MTANSERMSKIVLRRCSNIQRMICQENIYEDRSYFWAT